VLDKAFVLIDEPLLGEIVMVVMVMYHHDHLRLRRIRHCEAEDENQSKQKLFHTLIVTRRIIFFRAGLTYPRNVDDSGRMRSSAPNEKSVFDMLAS
jgi:hypothetical protein